MVKKDKATLTPEYILLDQLINDLYDAGVDVSYFPEGAKKVLIKYSKLIKVKKGGGN